LKQNFLPGFSNFNFRKRKEKNRDEKKEGRA